MLSSPVILTLLAGSATFIGAIFGVIGQKPSNRLLGFSLGFAAGIMLLISLMEMLPAALATEGMSPLLGYGMFIICLLFTSDAAGEEGSGYLDGGGIFLKKKTRTGLSIDTRAHMRYIYSRQNTED